MPLNARLARLSQDDWCYAATRFVFSDGFYRALVAGLDGLKWTEATQSFYKQREVNLKDSTYYQALFDGRARESISRTVGSFFGVEVGADFDIAAHKMINGDYIGVHTDENRQGETHRMTVTLNDSWSVTDGGVLLALKGGALDSIRDAWLPTANNGFLFEISERSFHAVTPIVGSKPRYSLIITFKRKGDRASSSTQWSPFPLNSDVQNAVSTAGHMGIEAITFEGAYRFVEFESIKGLKGLVGGQLHNTPTGWSYSQGSSINVDQHGRQPKGTDSERIAVIEQLRRIPPVLIVKRINGDFVLVDGSHRLSQAVDKETTVGVVIFDEQ